MKVRITRGMYGHCQNGMVQEKTRESGSFEVSDEEGKRLIELGVAKQVSEEEDYVQETERDEEQAELEAMKIEELRRVAADLGIKKSGSKEELIERIRMNMESDEEPMEEDEIPELTAEEPE